MLYVRKSASHTNQTAQNSLVVNGDDDVSGPLVVESKVLCERLSHDHLETKGVELADGGGVSGGVAGSKALGKGG